MILARLCSVSGSKLRDEHLRRIGDGQESTMNLPRKLLPRDDVRPTHPHYAHQEDEIDEEDSAGRALVNPVDRRLFDPGTVEIQLAKSRKQ